MQIIKNKLRTMYKAYLIHFYLINNVKQEMFSQRRYTAAKKIFYVHFTGVANGELLSSVSSFLRKSN